MEDIGARTESKKSITFDLIPSAKGQLQLWLKVLVRGNTDLATLPTNAKRGS